MVTKPGTQYAVVAYRPSGPEPTLMHAMRCRDHTHEYDRLIHRYDKPILLTATERL
jgi:hypothetical protein